MAIRILLAELRGIASSLLTDHHFKSSLRLRCVPAGQSLAVQGLGTMIGGDPFNVCSISLTLDDLKVSRRAIILQIDLILFEAHFVPDNSASYSALTITINNI